MAGDLLSLVESAYDLEAPETAWLQTLAEQARDLVPGARIAAAYTVDFSDPDAPVYSDLHGTGLSPRAVRSLTLARTTAGRILADRFHLGMRAKKVSTASEQLGIELRRSQLAHFAHDIDAPESFGCVGLDAEGRGVVLTTHLPEVTRLPRSLRARWQLVAVHLAAAFRLRRRDCGGAQDDFVVDPSGRIAHAADQAARPGVRERLRAAAVARDRARTRRVRSCPDASLELWSGLVEGRWSLVDRFDRDGRRYVVARRNEPRPDGPPALTPRERQVLGHLIQGDSTKVTAYALGCAPSTVSETAARLRLKLGARSVADLAAFVSRAQRRS